MSPVRCSRFSAIRIRSLVGLLLGLLLVQTGGPMLFFSVQQQQIRREVKKRIKAGVGDEDLVRLAIPVALEQGHNTRFQRIHSREFRYDGLMYDIVHQERSGDTTYYACILDEAESALFANLHQLMRDEASRNPERQKQRQKAQRLLDTQYLAGFEAPMQDGEGESDFSPYVYHPPQSRHITPLTPPPETTS